MTERTDSWIGDIVDMCGLSSLGILDAVPFNKELIAALESGMAILGRPPQRGALI